ncbi:unnamed protein product [Lasius platythorax]|uniref:Uncharacterized protein n=1 Tax=Lasius platythorax TaxID=488582 RepID=A0AAV2MX04_9HYME
MNGVQKNGVQLNGVQLNRVQNFVSICNVSNCTVFKCTAPGLSRVKKKGANRGDDLIPVTTAKASFASQPTTAALAETEKDKIHLLGPRFFGLSVDALEPVGQKFNALPKHLLTF